MKIQELIDKIEISFFPIRDINNNTIYGYEVILNNINATSYLNKNELFDYAYQNKNLYRLDFKIRKKFLMKFNSSNLNKDKMLFYELDNRILEMPDYKKGKTLELMKKLNLLSKNLCFNISEKHKFISMKNMLITLRNYRNQGYKISINNFGDRFSNIKLLYNCSCDYLFLDSFLTTDINFDRKKQILVQNIIDLCKTFGIAVIARGIKKMEIIKKLSNLEIPLIQNIYKDSIISN